MPQRGERMASLSPLAMTNLERDDFSSNPKPALSFCLSMISAQTLRVCRKGKPVPTFPDHALVRGRQFAPKKLIARIHVSKTRLIDIYLLVGQFPAFANEEPHRDNRTLLADAHRSHDRPLLDALRSQPRGRR